MNFNGKYALFIRGYIRNLVDEKNDGHSPGLWHLGTHLPSCIVQKVLFLQCSNFFPWVSDFFSRARKHSDWNLAKICRVKSQKSKGAPIDYVHSIAIMHDHGLGFASLFHTSIIIIWELQVKINVPEFFGKRSIG